MIKTIYFNDRCASWSYNYIRDAAFVKAQINWVYDTLKHKGYIYLDRIYEAFGAKWDPHEPNDVLIFGECEPVISHKFLSDDSFRITILY